VYWINVPVGIAAVIAGRYLLPRTRHLSRTDSFDWLGAALLAVATTALLVALSVIAGLPAPAWLTVMLAVIALAAAAAFAARQLRARFPLIPRALLRSARLPLGLAGAFLGYLVLFGPLVLVPQLLDGQGNAVRTGLILSALPVGFGLAALTAESLFPAGVPNRIRGGVGAAVSAAALITLIFVAGSTAGIAVLLGLTGLGLGMFVPANNAVIMRSGTAGSAAVLGGLVSMARGIGTTFGIALVTLALHLGGTSDGSLAFAVLGAAAAGAVLIAMTIRPLSSGEPHAVARHAPEHSSVFS
jgi:hypothetical protein